MSVLSTITPLIQKISQLARLQKKLGSYEKFKTEGEVGAPEYDQQSGFLALDNPDWQPAVQERLLYIIRLNAAHLKFLSKRLSPLKDCHNNLSFYAHWLSYAKDGKTLVDVVHAHDGFTEQLHISHTLTASKKTRFMQKIQLNTPLL